MTELSRLSAPVLVGSQAIHGAVEQVPESVTASFEADFLLDHVAPSDLRAIGRELGAFSEYQDSTGTHADPVRRSILTLPRNWESRLQPLTDCGRDVALCLEPHDISVSKIAAGRDKDWTFIGECTVAGIIDVPLLLKRCEAVPEHSRRLIVARNLKVLVERLESGGVTVDPVLLARTLNCLERTDGDPSGRGS